MLSGHRVSCLHNRFGISQTGRLVERLVHYTRVHDISMQYEAAVNGAAIYLCRSVNLGLANGGIAADVIWNGPENKDWNSVARRTSVRVTNDDVNVLVG